MRARIFGEKTCSECNLGMNKKLVDEPLLFLCLLPLNFVAVLSTVAEMHRAQ